MKKWLFLTCLYLSTELNALTIEAALENFVKTYPGIQANYQDVRAAASRIDFARSGYRPTAYTYGSIGLAQYTRESDRKVLRAPKLLGIAANQPLYRGGRTLAAVREAKLDLVTEELSYQQEMDRLLLETASLYIDALHGQEILKATLNNQKCLQHELNVVHDRYKEGDVTSTDLAQARSRLAGSEANVIESRRNLRSTKAELERFIGIEVGTLELPKFHLEIPPNQQVFIQKTLSQNKELAAQMARWESAQQAYQRIKGELYPEVNFDAYAQHNRDQSIRHEYAQEIVAEINLTMPLYQGGRVCSRLREVSALVRKEILIYQEMEKILKQNCIQAWENYEAAKFQINVFKVQLEAAEIALKGVQEEESAGMRTVLDILNAEYEVLNAKVNLIDAHRNCFIAELEIMHLLSNLYERFFCASTS